MRIEVLWRPGMLRDAAAGLGHWATDLRIAYAWATASGGAALHWQGLPMSRVSRALIGIHFAQTEPWALRQLAEVPDRLRVVEDTEGVFHPKLMLGVRAGVARAIVGSSNFTSGGFGSNTELNLLVEGARDEGPLADLIEFFDVAWGGPLAFEPDGAWIDRYERMYADRPQPPRPTGGPGLPRPGAIFAVRASPRGGSGSSIQCPGRFGFFFNLHDAGQKAAIMVEFEGEFASATVKLNHGDNTLNINFGRGKHLKLRRGLSKDRLLTFAQTQEGTYIVKLIGFKSKRAREIMAAAAAHSTSNGRARFTAGIAEG